LARWNGVLYITDTENNTIRSMNLATQQVLTYAGALGVSGNTDGPAASALFREPEGLAVDSGGLLYVGDVDNQVIRCIDLGSGTVSTVAGTAMMAGDTDGTGSAARLNKPTALAFDPTSGDVFIADSLNLAVRRFHPPTAAVTTLITLGVTPLGLAIDGTNVLVSTSDNRIVQVAMATGMSTTLAGTANSKGFVDGVGTAALFNYPGGLYNDGAGNLYVADYGNQVLRRMNLQTGAVTTFAGAQSQGSSDGTGSAARFYGPTGVATDGAGNFYVTDTFNHTIRQVVASTGAVTTLAGSAGMPGESDGQGSTARFNYPQGLAYDLAGHLYIADTNNNSVRKLDLSTGQVMTLGVYSDSGISLNSPTSIAVDNEQLLVSEPDAQIVLSINLGPDPAGYKMSVLAGTSGVSGSLDGIGGSAQFSYPDGLTVDGLGNLYVSDVYNQSVRQIVLATQAVSTLVSGTSNAFGMDPPWNYPTQLAASGVGDLFVADSLGKVVRHVNLQSGAVTVVVGNLALSGVLLGPLPAQLGYPAGLALTQEGSLAILSENSLLLAH
jgi:sugar lactone lactonase YvrE